MHSPFDISVIGLMSIFGFIGFYYGVTHELLGALIILCGYLAACYFSIPLSYMLSSYIHKPTISVIIANTIVFILTIKIIRIFFIRKVVTRFNIISAGTDGVLGGILGLIKGYVICLLIFSCIIISGLDNKITAIRDSNIAPILYKTYKVSTFLLPESTISGAILHLANTRNIENKSNVINDKKEDIVDIRGDGSEKKLSNIVDKMSLTKEEFGALENFIKKFPPAYLDDIYNSCCAEMLSNGIQDVKEKIYRSVIEHFQLYIDANDIMPTKEDDQSLEILVKSVQGIDIIKSENVSNKSDKVISKGVKKLLSQNNHKTSDIVTKESDRVILNHKSQNHHKKIESIDDLLID